MFLPYPNAKQPQPVRLRLALFGALALAMFLTACNRDAQTSGTPRAHPTEAKTTPASVAGGQPPTPEATAEREADAVALAEGERLYSAYNCNGCHSAGGGGMGPPLMDEQWIYGGRPEQIFATIVEGRPNGMPSFRGKIPEAEIWQVVAYVRSLSEQAQK